jgi:hypothetical protein
MSHEVRENTIDTTSSTNKLPTRNDLRIPLSSSAIMSRHQGKHGTIAAHFIRSEPYLSTSPSLAPVSPRVAPPSIDFEYPMWHNVSLVAGIGIFLTMFDTSLSPLEAGALC